MEAVTLLFAACLILVGLLCVLIIKRGVTEAMYEQRRREMDRWNALVVQKRQMDRRRRKVWSIIETTYIKFNEKTKNIAEPSGPPSEPPDPWDALSTSEINAAFEQFMLHKPEKAMHVHAASFQSRHTSQSL